MFEVLKNKNKLLAIVVRSNFNKDGITFFTPNEFSQQLAYMKHSEGKIIEPHKHNSIKRIISFTQEVLFIKKGKLQVDFYDDNEKYLESRILEAGDVILLASGGHGFRVLEDLEMLEVKQGPYAGDKDKIRFMPVNESKIVLK